MFTCTKNAMNKFEESLKKNKKKKCIILLASKNTVNIFFNFSELELLALFIACLCHDIDHRGTTNSFQVSSVSRFSFFPSQKWMNDETAEKTADRTCCPLFQKSALASLYSSEGSVMEVSTVSRVILRSY